MEIKAKLEYKTEQEKINFIVEYNHKQGYEIRYSEEVDEEAAKQLSEEQLGSEAAEKLEQLGSEEATQDNIAVEPLSFVAATVHKYIEAWGDTQDEALQKAKQAKHAENLQKAYEAEENGTVFYKDALFETSTANTSKLSAQFIMIQSGLIESVQWLSKDDKQIELTGEDIATLGAMIAEYTGALWNVHYLAYKEQIEACETAEEVNEIVIEYGD